MSSHSSFISALSALESSQICLTGQSTSHSSYKIPEESIKGLAFSTNKAKFEALIAGINYPANALSTYPVRRASALTSLPVAPSPVVLTVSSDALKNYIAEIQQQLSNVATELKKPEAATVGTFVEPPLRVEALHSPTSDTGVLPTLLRIESGAALEQSPPFNLAIVLDRSGSMGGTPLERAKLAVARVIAKLRPGDKLHLVTYSDHAQVIFTNGTADQRRVLEQHLALITADGCTNIGAGLSAGYQCVKRSGATGRIFLLSDGLVNEGLPAGELGGAAAWTQANGVALTTYGLGDQFDEPLMTRLAQEGHGDYFYIAEPSDIDVKINKGMEVLLSLLATEAHFELLPAPGSQLEVFGPRTGNRIPVGDLCADDLRQVLVQLSGTGELAATWTLSLKLADGRMHQYRGSISATAGPVAHPPDVTVALAIARSSELDKQALAALQSGSRAAALTLKHLSVNALTEVAALDRHQLVSLMLNQARASLRQMEQSSVQAAVRAVNYDRHRGGGGACIVHRKCF